MSSVHHRLHGASSHSWQFTRFLNHSCDPNCGMFACYVDQANVALPTIAFFAMRSISEGEELTISYGSGEGNDGPESKAEFECQCGSANCRSKGL